MQEIFHGFNNILYSIQPNEFQCKQANILVLRKNSFHVLHELFYLLFRFNSTRQTANKFRVRKTTTKQIKLLCIKLTFWIGYANSIASKSYWCFCIVESVKLLKGIWKKSTYQFQRFCFAKAFSFSFSFVVSAIELFIRSVLMIYHSRNISQTNATSVRNSKLKKSYVCIRYRCLIFSEIQ